MTEAKAAAVVRPQSCQADLDYYRPYAVCERCGTVWDPAVPPAPACHPITIGRLGELREVLQAEVEALESSHRACLALKASGMAADPIPALQRAIRLRGVMRLLDRVTSDAGILDLLAANGRKNNKA